MHVIHWQTHLNPHYQIIYSDSCLGSRLPASALRYAASCRFALAYFGRSKMSAPSELPLVNPSWLDRAVLDRIQRVGRMRPRIMRTSRPRRSGSARGISAAMRRGAAPARGIPATMRRGSATARTGRAGSAGAQTRPTGSKNRLKGIATTGRATMTGSSRMPISVSGIARRPRPHRRPGTTGRQSDSGIGTNERQAQKDRDDWQATWTISRALWIGASGKTRTRDRRRTEGPEGQRTGSRARC